MFIRPKRGAGQSGGRGSRSPSSILQMTSSFLIPTNGFIPRIRISQQYTPGRGGGGGREGRRGGKEERGGGDREGGEGRRRRRRM